MSTPAAPRHRRFPSWAVVLVVVVVLVRGGVAWLVATGLGPGATDVDLVKYPSLVIRASGTNGDGTFHVVGEVDFARSGVSREGHGALTVAPGLTRR